jgi:hypothetical protein
VLKNDLLKKGLKLLLMEKKGILFTTKRLMVIKSLSEKSLMHVEKLQAVYNIRVSVPVLHIVYCKSYGK